ncbi:MAG: glycosyltransferase family 39 protein [Proteobacteria bacterium]|nr:glycosyltransferase family 39 protein [Pseudomonadota bacterium]
MVNKDGMLYIEAAQKIAGGHFKEGLSIYPMPFYPILISMFHFLIPDWVSAARIISITFIVFTLVPLYLLTKKLFDRNAAFWACLAFAIAPFPNDLADGVIRDPGFIFCIAWAVYFAFRSSQEPRIFFLFMTAVFSVSSIFFRIEGIILILFSPVYFLALYFIEKQKRAYLLKGSILLIMVPLFLLIIFFIFGQNSTNSFNRSFEIYSEFQRLFKIEFLDNYYVLSDQLKTLSQSSPVSGLRNNFSEITLHYIPVIYLLGLIETFIVVLSPLFLLPLFFSFNGMVQTNRVFVVCAFWLYILMAYYFLVKMDFLTSRFLSIPALLIYPWIGAGMHRFFEYLSGKLSQKVFAALFLLFFTMPVYECFEREWKQDNSLMVAAKWIANNPDTRKLRIITEDKRFLLYAGREYMVEDAFSGTSSDAFYNLDTQGGNYNELEQIAMQKKFDLVLLRVSLKKEVPKFKYLKKLKEFKGTKNISYVFSSPEVADKIGSK